MIHVLKCNLPIPGMNVYRRKILGTTETVKAVIYPREGVHVLFCYLVKIPVVDTEAPAVILLSNEHERRCLRARRLNDITGKHFVKFSLNQLMKETQQWLRSSRKNENSSQRLKVKYIIKSNF